MCSALKKKMKKVIVTSNEMNTKLMKLIKTTTDYFQEEEVRKEFGSITTSIPYYYTTVPCDFLCGGGKE